MKIKRGAGNRYLRRRVKDEIDRNGDLYNQISSAKGMIKLFEKEVDLLKKQNELYQKHIQVLEKALWPKGLWGWLKMVFCK